MGSAPYGRKLEKQGRPGSCCGGLGQRGADTPASWELEKLAAVVLGYETPVRRGSPERLPGGGLEG